MISNLLRSLSATEASRFVVAALAIGILLLVPSSHTLAQSSSQETDPYAVPETTDILELQVFISRLSAIQPENLDAYEQHMIKLPIALSAVAQRIMELETDPTSPTYAQAEFLTVVAEVLGVRQKTEEERAALVDKIAARLTNHPRLADDAGLAEQLAEAIDAMGDRELALRAYTTFGEKLASSSLPDIAILGQRMLGTVRRFDVVGSDFEYKGNLLDGSELDAASLKGKVVFVDFWATWCGPCIREMPRLADLYRLYKDDGFEIIAVSLDADRIRAEEFLTNERIAWPCLFQDGTGWDHPLAVHYGIKALPTTFLIDQNGKVVAMDLRSEELADKLPELLGVARRLPTPAPSPSQNESSSEEPLSDDGDSPSESDGTDKQ